MFIAKLVGALRANDVQFCIVGGVAVNLHGVPRMTYDIDIMVRTTVMNLEACASAFAALGLVARLPIALVDVADRDLAATWEQGRNLIEVTYTDPNNPLNEVDVLVAPSLDPDGVVARAGLVGTGIPVASVDDLIALKRRANRSQDQADIAHLERLRS